MTTRRNVIALLAVAPWLIAPARAANKITAERLYKMTADRLGNLQFVRSQYYTARFFVELLRQYPPDDKKYKYDPKEMDTSIATLTRMILNEKKPYTGIWPDFLKEWLPEYDKRQPTLYAYFKQVGIVIDTPVDMMVETSLFSMITYFASVTGAKKLIEAKICIFPFCDIKPT